MLGAESRGTIAQVRTPQRVKQKSAAKRKKRAARPEACERIGASVPPQVRTLQRVKRKSAAERKKRLRRAGRRGKRRGSYKSAPRRACVLHRVIVIVFRYGRHCVRACVRERNSGSGRRVAGSRRGHSVNRTRTRGDEPRQRLNAQVRAPHTDPRFARESCEKFCQPSCGVRPSVCMVRFYATREPAARQRAHRACAVGLALAGQRAAGSELHGVRVNYPAVDSSPSGSGWRCLAGASERGRGITGTPRSGAAWTAAPATRHAGGRSNGER